MNTHSYAGVQSWGPFPRIVYTTAFPNILTTSTNEQTPVSQPTSVVRDTLGKEQLFPIIAKKVHQEKVQQENLKAVRARLNFEEPSQHSESGTPSKRRGLKERLRSKHVRSMSESPELRHRHSESPRKETQKGKWCSKGWKKVYSKGSKIRGRVHPHTRTIQGVDHTTIAVKTLKAATRVLAQKKQSLILKNVITKEHPPEGGKHYQNARIAHEDIGGQIQRGKGRVLRMTCLSHGHIKTYDGSEDLEDHLKIFQAAAKTERWAVQTWCHMFNSTLTENARVWFEDLLKDSIDSYDDLKEAFLENYLWQKKCIKDPDEIYNIKQRDGEFVEEFVRRYKLGCRDIKGAPKCMKISGFMHGITNPELIKRLHDKIPKLVDEMMRVTTTFLKGEVAASNRERKKSFPSWKQQEAGHKPNFKKGDFQNQQRPERKQDRFTLLTKTTKEIPALDKGKFKPPPPMTTLIEKRNAGKFCEFHGESFHSRETEFVSENTITKGHPREGWNRCQKVKVAQEGIGSQSQRGKSRVLRTICPNPVGEVAASNRERNKSFPLWKQQEAAQKQNFKKGGFRNQQRPKRKQDMFTFLTKAPKEILALEKGKFKPPSPMTTLVEKGTLENSTVISFPPLGEEDGTEGPMIIEPKIGRSSSPYNGIIGRPGVRRIQAVPSTAHEMIKFLVTGETVTLRSSRIIPLECIMVLGPGMPQPVINQVTEEKIQVAIHPEYPKQTIAIGSTLTEEGRKEPCGLLRPNLDIFAWKPADMTGVLCHIAEHRLNIRERCVVKQ
nr:reverse transcriptase domain-containing protein [Tanacetum cinerariifolium]